jgi:ATP-dependent Lon protease
VTAPDNLPLFPLPLVVLPGELKPLHIFEERYRELLRDCEARAAAGGSGAFGILFVHAKGMAEIGTAVTVRKILKAYPDGRRDILVEGEARFRLRRLVSQKTYDQGEVEWRSETPEDWDDALANRVFVLHRRLLRATLDEELADGFYGGTPSLSLRVAPSSALTCAQKQQLLELDSENARLALIAKHLESFLATLERAAEGCRALREFWAVRNLLRPDDPPPAEAD